MNTLNIIFGSDQVKKYNLDKKLTNEEFEINYQKYLFDTEAKRIAFIKGIEAIVGWRDYIIIKEDL